MSFNPEQLRRMALEARKNKTTAEAPVSSKSAYTDEEVDVLFKDLETSVADFAMDGELYIDYKFNDNVSSELIQAVADRFKTNHPKLMVITSKGQITVTWDGKNHV